MHKLIISISHDCFPTADNLCGMLSPPQLYGTDITVTFQHPCLPHLCAQWKNSK